MSALYITELQDQNQPRSKSLEKKATNILLSDKSPQSVSKSTKNDFLEFLIHDETKFADLEKIEDFYQSQAVKNHNDYNKNEHEIANKKLKLKQLEETIEHQIVSHVKIKEEDLISHYERLIEDLKQRIILKEHDLECYQHVYQRLYKANYLINKRYNEELKFELINTKQFSKYQIIKNNAILSVNKQKGFLNDMKVYDGMSGVRFDSDVEKKKKKFNELEYQVYTIRSDTVQIQKKLDDIKAHIHKVYHIIKETKGKNMKIKGEYRILLQEYLKSKIKLLQIYKGLKVKSLDDIIKIFNEQRFQYQSLYSQFINFNKLIAELNMEYTGYKKELDQVKVKIEEKMKLIDSQEKINPMTSGDENLITSDLKLKETKEMNSSSRERIMNSEKTLNNVAKYLSNYDSKLNDLLVSTYLPYNLSYKSINRKNSSPSRNPSKLQNGNNFFSELQSYSTSAFIADSDKGIEWMPVTVNKTLSFFVKFCQKVMISISTICTNVAVDLTLTSSAYKLQSPYSTPKHTSNNLQLVYIFDNVILTQLEEFILQAMIRHENKIKILNRTEREIFKDRKPKLETNKNEKSEILKKKTSMENIYSNFYGYLSKLGEEEKLNFLKNLKTKMLSQMYKYTNELVQNEMEDKIEMKKSMSQSRIPKTSNKEIIPLNSNKTSNTNTHLNTNANVTSTRRNTLIKKDEQMASRASLILQQPNSVLPSGVATKSVDDSYTSLPEVKEVQVTPEVFVFGMKKKDKEMVKIYQRMDDLRNLELKYFNDREKQFVNNDEFNEIYYNFKKKFLHQGHKRSKTSSGTHQFFKLGNSASSNHMNIQNSYNPNLIGKSTNMMGKTVSNFKFKKDKSSQNKTQGMRMKKDLLENLMKEDTLEENEKMVNTVKNGKDFKNSTMNGFSSTKFSNYDLLASGPSGKFNINANVPNLKNSYMLKEAKNKLKSGHNRSGSSLPYVNTHEIAQYSRTKHYTNLKK